MNDIDASARQNILNRIGEPKEWSVDLPDIPDYSVGGDPVRNFISKLEAFDGKAVRVADRASAIEWLKANIPDGKTVFSAVDGFEGNFTVNADTDPHSAHVVDVAVGNGLMGVGETGSVWVTDDSLGLTACALFATDLYLIVDKHDIVDGIHTAYSKLRLGDLRYGSFYTGPSATADIEAIHISGAQGPVSLTVLIIGA